MSTFTCTTYRTHTVTHLYRFRVFHLNCISCVYLNHEDVSLYGDDEALKPRRMRSVRRTRGSVSKAVSRICRCFVLSNCIYYERRWWASILAPWIVGPWCPSPSLSSYDLRCVALRSVTRLCQTDTQLTNIRSNSESSCVLAF